MQKQQHRLFPFPSLPWGAQDRLLEYDGNKDPISNPFHSQFINWKSSFGYLCFSYIRYILGLIPKASKQGGNFQILLHHYLSFPVKDGLQIQKLQNEETLVNMSAAALASEH